MDIKEIKSYKSVKQKSETDEIIINKSRFIGYCFHAMTEDGAKGFINDIIIKHPEASCICHAYICGMTGQVQKYFDGHEPIGGIPILEVIKMKKLTAVCCAVVRYFGGVKLGAGGLARAFSNTATKAIDLAIPIKYILSNKYILTVDYAYQGKIDYMMSNSRCKVGKSQYGEKISVEIISKKEDYQDLASKISGITNGNHELKIIGNLYKCW